MQVLDLTAQYIRLVLREHSWSRYERVDPALFRHYFRFWAKRTYPDVKITTERLEGNAARLRRRLPLLEKKFNKLGLNPKGLEIVLFVGKGCTNGHAMLDASKWRVWLPVETYPNDQLVDVFATHEIIHALHYRAAPDYYFRTAGQHRNLGRLLVTEGLATYLTRRVLGCSSETALWGGYLPKRRLLHWKRECTRRVNEMAEFATRHFRSIRHADFFQANEPANIMRYRGGYYLGDVVIENIVRQNRLSPTGLLRLSRSALDELVLQQLGSMREEQT